MKRIFLITLFIAATAYGASRDQVISPTPERFFGKSEFLGVSKESARRDHTHGTPVNPTTEHTAGQDPHTQYLRKTIFTSYTTSDRLTVARFNSYTSVDRLPVTVAVATYVPYSSASKDVKIGTKNLYLNASKYSTTPVSVPAATGVLSWNSTEDTLDIQSTNQTTQVGQELSPLLRNMTGSTINNMTPVMFAGAVGASGRIKIQPAIANGTIPSVYIFGVTTETIASGADGHVTSYGKVRGVNTTGSLFGETWADGDVLYVSPTTAGYLTKVPPDAPNLRIEVAAVVYAHSVVGTLFVRPSWTNKLVDLDDVDGIPPGNGDVLQYDTAGPYWKPVTAGTLPLARIGSSTYSTVQHLQDIFHSAGYVSGGAITDAGGATVNVAAGTGLIRATNSAVATIKYFDWPASNGLAITADSIRYVGVEYNAGTPQVTVRTTQNWNYHTDFPLGRVVNEGGALQILVDPQAVGDHASTMIQREAETMPLAYDMRGGGLILGETGTRNITLSAGALWDRLNRFAISALNTSVSGSFDSYYQNGSGGFTKVATQTQWPNTQYDDGTGTLATMTAARYANLWFYIETDNQMVMLYGRAQYATLAAALNDAEPATVPNRIMAHGRLVGRLTYQKSAGTAVEIASAFTTMLPSSGTSNHANLSNLDYASAGHTGFVPDTRTVNGSALSGDVTVTTITGNAGTATTLATGRTINGVTFDGSANIQTATSATSDYVTGTWTPAFESTGLTVGYATQNGKYTKIGNTVFASFYVHVSSVSGTTTNTLRISGLPSSTVSTDYGWSSAFGVHQFSVTPTGFIGASSNKIELYQSGTVTALTGAALQTGFYLGSVVYHTN